MISPEPAGRLAGLFERWNARFASMGVLALAALALAMVTGVALAIGYDVHQPRRALAILELSSLAGRLLRGVHSWCGHLLVVLVLLHLVEHLARRTERDPGWAVWLRAVLGVPLVLGVMLTGFILKGDAESDLARQILAGLLERLPAAGAALSSVIVGAGTDLQVVYVHHAATFTVLLGLVAIEHARRIWPSATATLAILLASLLLAFLLQPTLHDGIDPIVKGPWYLLAVQEALSWLSHPVWIWPMLVAPLALLAALPRVTARWRHRTVVILAAGFILYSGAGAFAALFRGAGWELRSPFPRAEPSRSSIGFGRPTFATLSEASVGFGKHEVEGCVGCHSQVRGVEPAHDPKALGCFACHLGDPTAADAAGAHRGMVRVPGNLDTALLTCGQKSCHGDLIQRVRGSPMATARGIVSVDRWAFGEHTPDGVATIDDLRESPADSHLRQLCTSCHLGKTKEAAAPATELSRGGGCAACHVNYPETRDYSPKSVSRFTHPSVRVQVHDAACFGCHSRSGRISLAYSGWHESGIDEAAAVKLPAGSWRKLQDGRIVQRAAEDIHHANGMACVDCHLAREAMGDGTATLHEEQATRIKCETCHRTSAALSAPIAETDADANSVTRLRWGDQRPSRLLLEDRSRSALTNAWPVEGGTIEMRGKLSGRKWVAKPPSHACTDIPGHERISCQACHSAWSPSCVSCHTQWDGAARNWVEYDGPSLAEPPALGLVNAETGPTIAPAIPGMIMTLNLPGYPTLQPLPEMAGPLLNASTRLVRAFARSAPHTTTREGRSCASCHLEPHALGWGHGTLRPGPDWGFQPSAAPLRDGLPADAWVASLSDRPGIATRGELHPLDRETQLRTLAVGPCLSCHDPNDPKHRAIYQSFHESLGRMSPSCRTAP